jgi:high-affinity nickel permease
MLGLLSLGFLIGMRHALEADHVAAVSSLATRSASPKECVRQGIFWGVGHLTLFLFGSAVLLLDHVLPERLARASSSPWA